MSGSPPTDNSEAMSAITQGGVLMATSIAFVVLSAIIVLARLFTRGYIVRCYGADDLFIVFAWLASLGMSITMIEQLNKGMNDPSSPTADPIGMMKAFWASVWTYNLALMMTKISMSLQYFRIFIQKGFRIANMIVLAFVIGFGTWTVVGSIIVCVPVHFAWTSDDLTGSNTPCQNRFAAWFTNAAIHMLLDLILIILPMPFLKKLNMPWRQKIPLMFIFAIGIFVCAMSVVRLYFLIEMFRTDENDNTATWSVIEVNVGIACASLPSLKALIARLWPRFSGSSRRSAHQRTKTGTMKTYDSYGVPFEMLTRTASCQQFVDSLGLKEPLAYQATIEGGFDPATRGWRSRTGNSTDGNEPRPIGRSMTKKVSSSPPKADTGIAVMRVLQQEYEEQTKDGVANITRASSEGSRTLYETESAKEPKTWPLAQGEAR